MAVPGGILKPSNQHPKKGRQITFAESTTVPNDMTTARQSTNDVAIPCFKPKSKVKTHKPLPPPSNNVSTHKQQPQLRASNKEKTKPQTTRFSFKGKSLNALRGLARDLKDQIKKNKPKGFFAGLKYRFTPSEAKSNLKKCNKEIKMQQYLDSKRNEVDDSVYK